VISIGIVDFFFILNLPGLRPWSN